ncbi:MAG: efflux RND transporter periplasmic adaptor subunit [bacterium]
MTKIVLTAIMSVTVGLAAGWFFFRSANNEGATAGRKILYYVDPMHPEYKSDKPGTAPDCGMDLVPVYEHEQGLPAEGGAVPGAVKITPEKQQLIGVQTDVVRYHDDQKMIRAVGQIAYAEPKQAYVTTKFDGYIENLFVDYTGKLVEEGQPLFTIYSPELVSTQEEYLLALKSQRSMQKSASTEAAASSGTLLESARRRLQLWDITEKEIDELARTESTTRTLTIYSPIRGYVLEKLAMRGLKVTPGMNLYQIADLSTVWIFADIYESEVPFVKIGHEAKVELTYYPGEVFNGRVTHIYPFLTPETRTVKVRLEFSNPGEKLKPGMYASVNLESGVGKQLAVPEEAVLDAGSEQIVFVVHEGGYFEPRDVELGANAGGRFIVLSGLKEGEKIVTSGNFLIDSESRLKSAASGMIGMGHGGAHGGNEPQKTSQQQPQAPPSGQPDHSGHVMTKSSQAREDSGHDMRKVEKVDGKKYTCSMHPEVVMDAPGTCPKCGMGLVERQ